MDNLKANKVIERINDELKKIRNDILAENDIVRRTELVKIQERIESLYNDILLILFSNDKGGML